jgi:hypothetical protein
MGSSLATILNQPVYKTHVKLRHFICYYYYYYYYYDIHGKNDLHKWGNNVRPLNSSRHYIYYDV